MDELEEEVKQLKNYKTAGLDGFTTKSSHACWDTIKEEVLEIVGDSRKNGKVLKDFNSMIISLTPKENGVESAGKFIHIALFNVIFKIITKPIANRLKPLLYSIISKEKSRYVEEDKFVNISYA